MANQGQIRKDFAEFIGTFTLIFLGCGSLMVAERYPGTVSNASVAVLFGLIVAALIYALGHVSGAHFNPAVTLSFAITRHFPWKQVFNYWIAQFLGSIAAIALLTILLPEGSSFGATTYHVTTMQAFGWEVMLTFFLMFVVMGVATDSRAIGTMAGAAIGATVTVCCFTGGAITGAGMNPARSLGPALFQGTTSNLGVYFLGPCVGAVLAGLVYKKICGET